MSAVITVRAYTCFTFRFPITFGETSGDTFITAMAYDGNYYVGGYSTSTNLKVGGSQSGIVIKMGGDL